MSDVSVSSRLDAAQQYMQQHQTPQPSQRQIADYTSDMIEVGQGIANSVTAGDSAMTPTNLVAKTFARFAAVRLDDLSEQLDSKFAEYRSLKKSGASEEELTTARNSLLGIETEALALVRTLMALAPPVGAASLPLRGL